MILRLTEVIDYLKPKVWMIENPRGRLRHFKPLKRWLESNGGSRLMVFYGNYNHYMQKPTDIWNDVGLNHDEQLRRKGDFKSIDELTLEERYAMPQKLCDQLIACAEVVIAKSYLSRWHPYRTFDWIMKFVASTPL